MEQFFDIQLENIRFFREELSEYDPTNGEMTLYEVYIKVSKEQEMLNAPTKYDTMMEELGYEFMDRDQFFDAEGNYWGGEDESDAPYWDKWYKFVPTIK